MNPFRNLPSTNGHHCLLAPSHVLSACQCDMPGRTVAGTHRTPVYSLCVVFRLIVYQAPELFGCGFLEC